MITMPGETADSPGNRSHYNPIEQKAKILFPVLNGKTVNGLEISGVARLVTLGDLSILDH